MITPSYSLTATERVLPRLALDWTTGAAQPGVDVARTGVATFVGANGLIQYATENTQRIDYSTGVAGLLVEESRENICPDSEEFDNWTVGSNYSVTDNFAVAPDGNQTADLLVVANGISSFSTSTPTKTISKASSAITYTYSCFYKLFGSVTSVRLFTRGTSSANSSSVIVSLLNGSVLSGPSAGGNFSNASVIVKNFGSGFYRVSLTFTSDASNEIRLRQFPYSGTSSFTGDGTSGLIAWGAQLETGASPTSYIPTEATAVTRNADVATMSGTDFTDWFNASAGAFFIETDARNGDDLLTAGSYVLTANATALKKYATTYGSDPSATQLDFGEGTIQKVMYYPQELIAAELAALTA